MKKRGVMQKYWKEFREFILKGNIINLAVGVVLGGAFQAVINSAVNDVFLPILSIFTKHIDFSQGFIDLTRIKNPSVEVMASAAAALADGRVVITYGTLITAAINFFIIGVVAFVVVKGINSVGDLGKKVKKRALKEEPPAAAPPTEKECPYCCSTIPVKATRCPQCTSLLPEKDEEEEEEPLPEEVSA